ncbi:pre-rRNA 2'-O-ribose RNA methyltransferase [Impatiens glandulifera]|uniref:pre-rRNA 2'-O-ribose RNA methyltransferase n=1 Tax=Impatiens glandulifera TaxID=253017 RepID=UPI001FB05D05|nr:pre-rRNA 2'-O-ribose RNA methyltransferase [Impatiens glandulifera]
MGKVKGKHRLDKYYHLAKEQGYRSRAAWKLIQLDSKFNFLRSSRGVLDLCAAPGGWMQVAVQRVPVGSLVMGLDLVPIRPIRGAVAAEEDITKPQCRSTIKKLMGEHGCRAVDLVLHDGSPNVGGAWAQEATSQNALVIDSVRLATEFLSPKGTFVTKVFRSQDYTAVLYCLRQLFEKVEVDKPAASRSASAEIYLIGLKYKAPAKIDPRLLDIRHLFEGGKEPPKVIDVLRASKQKRHRDGYEDGETIFTKVCSAADFVWSDNPLDMLGTVTCISFKDTASLDIKNHALTTEEVKSLCDDLRVLGKQDFKYLLKWRMGIKKALTALTEKPTPEPAVVENENKEENEEEKMLNEMEELSYAMDRKKKRAKKVITKRREKDKTRKATGMQMDAVEDGCMDIELFALSSIKGKKDLEAVDDTENGDIGTANYEEDEETREDPKDSSSSDMDSDEERQQYDEKLEEMLDEAYESYVTRIEGSALQKQRKRAKGEEASKDEQLQGNENDDMNLSDDSDREQDNIELNPLVVPFADEAPTQEEIMKKWFSQDIFEEDEEEEEQDKLAKYDSDDEMQVDKPVTKPTSNKKNEKKKPTTEKLPVQDMKKKNNKFKKETQPEPDFEIVPAIASDSSDSDSSSDESDYDNDKKAEILAYAKKMLHKKDRENLIDDSYNKYMFNDDARLPSWFVEDEKKHNRPNKPVTKEEINAMKAQFKEINARPAKKVAEARARKKRVAERKLEKIRKKANTISDQSEISDRSKRKMIEQLYNKATPKKPEREYVVAKKGVAVRGGKGKVVVDPRMKKDARTKGLGRLGRGGKGNPKKAGGGKKGQTGKGGKGTGKGSGARGSASSRKAGKDFKKYTSSR